MKELLKYSGIPFKGDYIDIPTWCKRVKIDIGLGHNAPQSEIWLESDPDLLVFAFEPVSSNVNLIRNEGCTNRPIKLNSHRINKSIYLIETALGNVENPSKININVTTDDPGCSSLLIPRWFKVKSVEEVNFFSLFHFFQYFPFHIIDRIDYLKTDCQGFDFDILNGIGRYLDRIAIVTSEAENFRYKNSNNSSKMISKFFKNNNFICFHKYSKFFHRDINIQVEDPTFINRKYLDEIRRGQISAYQVG
jgi:FkbM family methyltransferase